MACNAPVTLPVMNALSEEDGASTFAYRRWLVSPSQIAYDIWSVDGTQSMASIDRRLFKAAEALKDRSYSNVVLAYRGEAKFNMERPYFKKIGQTRLTENPIYTMRTMQEHLSNPDGSPAFQTWSGGWLGVLGKQIEDHNQFHRKWWVNDALGNPT